MRGFWAAHSVSDKEDRRVKGEPRVSQSAADPILSPKPPRLSTVHMTEMVLPNDANPHGNMLGGRVLHHIDMAAAIAAIRHAGKPCVTASFDSVDFLSPIHVGETCLLTARVTWTGRTSLEVHVDVYAENLLSGERRHTTSAYTTFVALDPTSGRPSVIPPLLLETDQERQMHQSASERRNERLARRQQREK
jgi:acyl-CoA hydrolase